MFGTKLRSWMEAHIVRSRKKQQRSKEAKNSGPKDPPPNPPHDSKNVECTIIKERSERGGEREGGAMSEAPTLHNLSSPESAYSTGYSTDGTSPGASIPPEYYINLRTGKHYVHTTTGNTTVTPGPGPASPHRKRKPKQPDGLPESSTEEDIAERPSKPLPPHKILTPKSQRKPNPVQNVTSNFHRRTESCDESQQRTCFPLTTERDSEGSSSTQTGASLPCQSPYLSTASPRQRNRIRTNPWLGANQQERNRNYTSQGETSSTVGSSSTLSSSGCKERIPREESRISFSPKPQNKKLEDIKNFNVFRNSTFTASPLVGGRKPLGTVTTCSPLPNRPCRHFRPGTSSSSSSAPSSGSDDNHHGNTSDFSDDDVTLNEMLGKYDESYIYEKETDILSDSDPTDCEDQNDYNDNSSHLAEEQQVSSDLDFIDTGSLVELANSDSECSGKQLNKGHCTYHNVPGHTPDMCRRQCSRMRRGHGNDGSLASSRGSSISNKRFRRASSRRADEISASADLLPKRFSNRKKLRQSSRERKRSSENIPKEHARNIQLRGVKNVPLPDIDAKIFEQGRHVNLNRVLMERLIHNQRSGTRSADGTPISLRRNGAHDYNGKYLRNPHVSKLIQSNTNLIERRTSIGEGNEKKIVSTVLKKRSNSVTGYSAVNPPPPALPPRNPPRSEKNPVDKEGDMKYRKLIQEAETILEGYQVRPSRQEYLSPTLSTRSAIIPNSSNKAPSNQYDFYENVCDMNSQLSMLEEKINNNPIPKTDNEEGIFKAISKTLEKIIIRSSESKKSEKNGDNVKSKKKGSNSMIFNIPIDNSPSNFSHQINANLRHSSEVLTTTDKNDNMFPACYTPTRFRIHNKTEILQTFHKTKFVGSFDNCEMERFRPLNKGVDIIRGTEPIYSPLNMSPKRMYMNNVHNIKLRGSKPGWQENKNETFIDKNCLHKRTNPSQSTMTQTQTEPPLVPFRSFDLGNQIAVSSRYCPQSEPVKRKVYVGSSTFGKLQKSLMRKNPEKRYPSSDMTTEDLRAEPDQKLSFLWRKTIHRAPDLSTS